MPETYNTAAKSTRKMADRRRSQRITVGLLAIGAIVVIYFLMTNSSSLGIGGIGFLVLLAVLRLIPDLFDNYSRKKEKTIRRADRGADAEEEVADLLNKLDDDFVVIHDVDSPYGNIDHIVISRMGGIYLLETKSHHGTVTTTDSKILVNGSEPEKDFVGQALQNSYWLREEIGRLLKITPWITPLVVFTNGFVKNGKPVKGVRAINRKYLLQTLQSNKSISSTNDSIWDNRDQIAKRLMGQEQNSVPPSINNALLCPQCGKNMILKVAKSGNQVGKQFWVCPDYPKCKTAIPIE